MFTLIDCLGNEIKIPKGNPHLWEMKDTELKVISKDGVEYKNVNFNTEKAKDMIREKRKKLLEAVDDKSKVLFWGKQTADDAASWKIYRQALLDITKNLNTVDDFINLQWPKKPQNGG